MAFTVQANGVTSDVHFDQLQFHLQIKLSEIQVVERAEGSDPAS